MDNYHFTGISNSGSFAKSSEINQQPKVEEPYKKLLSHADVKLQQSHKPEKFNIDIKNLSQPALGSVLGTIKGASRIAIGTAGSFLLVPLLPLETGNHADFSQLKKMTTQGAIIGSLGFIAMATAGKKTLKAEANLREEKAIHKKFKSEMREVKKMDPEKASAIITIFNKSIQIGMTTSEANTLLKAIKDEVGKMAPAKAAAIATIFNKTIPEGVSTLDAITLLKKIKKEVGKLDKLEKHGEAHSFEIGKEKHFFAIFKGDSSDSDSIKIAMKIDHLASGGSKHVFAGEFIHQQGIDKEEKIAILVPKSKKDAASFKMETARLKEVGGKSGIQEKLFASDSQVMVAELYDGDASHVLDKFSIKDKQRVTSDLRSALEEFKGKGIFHFDGKPENIFIKKVDDGYKFFLGDLTVPKEEEIFEKKFPENVFLDICPQSTSKYSSEIIFDAVEEILEKVKKDKQGKREDEIKTIEAAAQEKIVPLLDKMVEFSFGLTLYEIWVGKPAPITNIREGPGQIKISDEKLKEMKINLESKGTSPEEVDTVIGFLTMPPELQKTMLA
ncbi:MAG: hypothetical protein H0T62_10435 [Parachlamydiaceae bacterium]|nr:hypothetical protein [Parachlamydiaceae bacterium]